MFRPVSRAAVLVLALSLLGCGSKPKEPPPDTGPPVQVKATDLMKEYGSNALAADAKYKGKTCLVSGRFDSVQKAPLLGYVLQLLPEDAGDVNLNFVQCFLLDEAHKDVEKLKQGDKITIKGTCTGQEAGQVKMQKCTVAK